MAGILGVIVVIAIACRVFKVKLVGVVLCVLITLTIGFCGVEWLNGGGLAKLACTDTAPDCEYLTGLCDEPYMEGACEKSCGKCRYIDECRDKRPGAAATKKICALMLENNQCAQFNQPGNLVAGHCLESCGKCGAFVQEIRTPEGD